MTRMQFRDQLCYNLYADLRLELDNTFSSLNYTRGEDEESTDALLITYGRNVYLEDIDRVVNNLISRNETWHPLIVSSNNVEILAACPGQMSVVIHLINLATLYIKIALEPERTSEYVNVSPLFVHKGFDFTLLETLGYKEVVMEGGYVSPSRATIVVETRVPYQGQIKPYSSGNVKQYLADVGKLAQVFGVTKEHYLVSRGV